MSEVIHRPNNDGLTPIQHSSKPNVRSLQAEVDQLKRQDQLLESDYMQEVETLKKKDDELAAQLADTVKEVNGVKPTNGKVTIPVPEVDTSKLATKDELTGTNLRIDELVIESGDANAEVTDAHVSTIKNKTFTTLSNRIEETEQDTYLPAYNLISNGDFSNGKTGWSIYNSLLVASNNVLSVTNFSNGASSQVKQTVTLANAKKKKVYIRAFARVTNNVCTLLRLLPDGTNVSNPTENTWYELTSITTVAEGVSSVVPKLEQRYADTATATNKIMEVKYVLAIDLTSTFGEGNEPAINEMNAILSKFTNSWFNTEGNLFSAKKLVREVRRISQSLSNEYESLKWGVLGDSITANSSAYHKIIGDKLRMVVTNYGENGVCIGTKPSISRGLAEKYTTMSNDLDIITVFAGTNDARTNDPNGQTPIGKMSDRTVETFYGACHVLYKGLIEKYPGKKLGVITPIPQETNWGGTLESYANASKEVAHYYSIPVLDLFHESGLNASIPIIKTTYVPDGLHPNTEGHKVLARRIEAFIKSL